MVEACPRSRRARHRGRRSRSGAVAVDARATQDAQVAGDEQADAVGRALGRGEPAERAAVIGWMRGRGSRSPSARACSSSTGCSDDVEPARRGRLPPPRRELDDLRELAGARAEQAGDAVGAQVGELAREQERELVLVVRLVERAAADQRAPARACRRACASRSCTARLVLLDVDRRARDAERREHARQHAREVLGHRVSLRGAASGGRMRARSTANGGATTANSAESWRSTSMPREREPVLVRERGALARVARGLIVDRASPSAALRAARRARARASASSHGARLLGLAARARRASAARCTTRCARLSRAASPGAARSPPRRACRSRT